MWNQVNVECSMGHRWNWKRLESNHALEAKKDLEKNFTDFNIETVKKNEKDE